VAQQVLRGQEQQEPWHWRNGPSQQQLDSGGSATRVRERGGQAEAVHKQLHRVTGVDGVDKDTGREQKMICVTSALNTVIVCPSV